MTQERKDRYETLLDLLQKIQNQQEAINYRTTRLELQINALQNQLQTAAIDQEVISKYAAQHMTGPQIRTASTGTRQRKEVNTADEFKRNYKPWDQ